MPLAVLRRDVEHDLQALNHLVKDKLSSDVLLVNQVGQHIIESGGKRLRPLLLILSANACAYEGQDHILLAAIIEFIHTATLLHDDVVDASLRRRGQKTANAIWGNHASVLVGDFLYSRSFQMMASLGNLRVMQLLADTTNTIAEGEVLQMINCRNVFTTESEYFEVIRRKTAELFAAAAELGALVSHQSVAVQKAFRCFGMELGFAFQLMDDVLDYRGNNEVWGKNLGDDLAEGKPTLPLIYAFKHGSETERACIQNAIETGDITKLEAVQSVIESTNAILYTQTLAHQHVEKAKAAIQPFADVLDIDKLLNLAAFAVTRDH